MAAEAREALRGVDTVVHVGGLTRAASETAYWEVNARGTLALAREAARAGVHRFVFISTLAARGPDGAAGPTSPYGSSKREAEDGLRAVATDMTIVVLRPGGVYGPRDREFLPLFRMAQRGWLPVPARGRPLQPVYAEDLAAVVLAAGESGETFGPYPVVGRERYSWEDVAGVLGAVLHRRVRPVQVANPLFVAAGALTERLTTLARRVPRFDRRRAEDLATYSWTADPEPTIADLGAAAGRGTCYFHVTSMAK